MNKALYIILGIVFIVALGLTGFYLYTVTKIGIPVATGSPAPGITTTITSTKWSIVQPQIGQLCKPVFLKDQTLANTYLLKLYQSLGNDIKFDQALNCLAHREIAYSVAQSLILPQEEIALLLGLLMRGKGNIAFEDKTGAIQKVTIDDFPIPTPPPKH